MSDEIISILSKIFIFLIFINFSIFISRIFGNSGLWKSWIIFGLGSKTSFRIIVPNAKRLRSFSWYGISHEQATSDYVRTNPLNLSLKIFTWNKDLRLVGWFFPGIRKTRVSIREILCSSRFCPLKRQTYAQLSLRTDHRTRAFWSFSDLKSHFAKFFVFPGKRSDSKAFSPWI